MLGREALYRRSPEWLQKVAVQAEGLRIHRYRYGGGFPHTLSQFRLRDDWTRHMVESLQLSELSRALQRASLTPFYSRLFQEMGADWQDFASHDGMKALPITHKSDVAGDPTAFRVDGVIQPTSQARTSGTTGRALSFPVTRQSVQTQWAVWWRHRLRHGIPFGTWHVLVSGRVVAPGPGTRSIARLNHAGRQLIVDPRRLTPESVSDVVKIIEQKRISWLHGYPSSLSKLSDAFQPHLNHLSSITHVTTGAEALTPNQRQHINDTLAVVPVEHYGLAEGVANVSQCPLGVHHVDDDFSLVEFEPVSRHSSLSRIVGTSFSNDAFQLLRYDTGDLVTPTVSPCSCGLPGRTVSAIQGRNADFIDLPDGRRIGPFNHMFKNLDFVTGAQVLSHPDGFFEVRVMSNSLLTAQQKAAIECEVSARASQVNFRIVQVSGFQSTPSGKQPMVVFPQR